MGYFEDDIFLYDCLHAVWHQAWWSPDTPRPEVGQVCEEGGRMMMSVCGEMFTEIEDRAGARIFAATAPDAMTYCSCIHGRPPEKAPPSRMADLV